MIVLNNTTVSLEIDLGGAVATNQLPFSVHYEKVSSSGKTSNGLSHGQTNSTTAVTMLSAPAVGEQLIIKSIFLYNADTVNVTATIQLNDNTTLRPLFVVTLATLENLVYESGTGWTAYTTAGAIK